MYKDVVSARRETASGTGRNETVHGSVFLHKERAAFPDWPAPTCFLCSDAREDVSELVDMSGRSGLKTPSPYSGFIQDFCWGETFSDLQISTAPHPWKFCECKSFGGEGRD